MRNSFGTTCFLGLLLAAIPAAPMSGRGTPGVLSLVPFPQISAVQLFDQPNFTVALSVTSAVTVPAAVGKINWVFGGGGAGSTAELTAKAAGFNPACEALDVPVKSVLSWTGGARSSSHDV